MIYLGGESRVEVKELKQMSRFFFLTKRKPNTEKVEERK